MRRGTRMEREECAAPVVASRYGTLPDALRQLEDDLRAMNRRAIREAFRVL